MAPTIQERDGVRRLSIFLGWTLLSGLAWAGPGDSPDVAGLKATLANDALPIEERSRRALEGAAAIDQAAQQAGRAADRRGQWTQAVGLLDEFVTKHPGVEAAPLIRFQAAVYRWAEGRSFADQWLLSPADAKLREGATRAIDDAVLRFRAIEVKPPDAAEPFAQNLRFRLAQAIADRARLETTSSPARLALDREALGMLDGSLTLPGLRPFARLLHAEVANRLGLYGQAQIDVEQAEKLTPPPPAEAVLEAKVAALTGRNLYDEARKAIEAAKVAERLKGLLTLRVVLATRREKPPGRDREAIDEEAFRIVEKARGSTDPDGRRAMMELAKVIDEPPPDSPGNWWDLLAEGHARLGDPIRAGRLNGKGGDRAEALGRAAEAASLRYKAGAYLFEAGTFAEADRRLTQVVNQPQAPRDLKSRAGMLRALARGRAVATREPDASRAGYLEALEAQVRDFPDDASTGEARWLLGQVRLSAGRVDDALTLWAGIPHGHARWLEAQGLIADRRREAVESQRLNRDNSAVAAKVEAARASLRSAIEKATDGPEAMALTLRLARLELIPEAGKSTLALEACDRALRLAARPEQHRAARLLRMVALAQSGRSIEAEKVATAEARTDDPAALLPALRLLDRSASDAEAELARRRFGLIARILTTRLVDSLNELPEALRDEARLQHARALLFSGDPAAARKTVAAWGGPSSELDDDLLRELSDLYQRLDAHSMAIEAERYRSARLAPGTLPWFEAKYGLALAYFRSDRPREARQLIDATAILHPDLGGGELKVRFERLRQKIGQD
jgi:hypothetical protein